MSIFETLALILLGLIALTGYLCLNTLIHIRQSLGVIRVQLSNLTPKQG
jgi:hypothetical protein